MIICSFHNKDCAISDIVDTDEACWTAPDGERAVLRKAHTPLVTLQLGDTAGGPISEHCPPVPTMPPSTQSKKWFDSNM